MLDSESNNSDLSSLGPSYSEKKIFPIFVRNDVTRRRGHFLNIQMLFSPLRGPRELKLLPINSESHTTSNFNYRFLSKKYLSQFVFILPIEFWTN